MLAHRERTRTRVPTLRTTSHRCCCYPAIVYIYKHMREVFKKAVVPQQHPSVGVASSMRVKTGAGGALHCPNDYITDALRDKIGAPERPNAHPNSAFA